MTIDQIHERVVEKKPCSRRQVIRYIVTLNIQPIGARQRPQHYPDNSAALILEHLGFSKPARIISVKEAKRLASKGGAK